MTFFTYVGTLTSPGTTGNQVITDPGFQPKAVLFFDGGGTGALLRMSQTAGATGNAATQAYQSPNVSTGVASVTAHRETEAVNHWTVGTATLQKTATLASFDATGFTLNWSLAVAGASINYLAIGGTDVLVAGGAISQTTTANRVVTGLGFSPKMVLFLTIFNSTPFGVGFGAATGSTARWANSRNSVQSFTMATNNVAARLQDATKCIQNIGANGSAQGTADFVSMDADGFTVNFTVTNPKIATIASWIAFGGNATFSVGTFAKAANTTQTSITINAGLPLAPQAYLIASEASTVNTSLTDGWRSSVGVTDGTRSRAVAMENKALVLPTQAFSNSDATKVLVQRAAPVSATVAGASEVVMSHNAFTATGFTVDLTTNTIATAFVYPYITFGPSAAGPGYKDLTGSAAGVASVTQTLVRTRALTAAATGLSTATGTISKLGAAVYRDLTGAAVASSISTATPTRKRQLIAASVAVATTTSLLTRRKALSAASAGIAVATATPTRRRALAAVAVGSSSAIGTTTGRRALTGATTGSAVTLGFVDKAGSLYRPLFGASVGRATSVGTTTRRRALVVASVGSATTVAAPSRRRPLSAASVGQATIIAFPTRRRPLAAISTGVSSASGSIGKTSSLPTTSVVWAGDHFEMGVVGTLVGWNGAIHQFDTSSAQVVWEDDRFEVAA